MSEKLLSCPFCGGEAKTSDTTTDEENKFKFGWIGCQECRVFINYINNQRGKQAAIAAWNRRADARQLALKTRVCPMCEDCPDGCPIETPQAGKERGVMEDTYKFTIEYYFSRHYTGTLNRGVCRTATVFAHTNEDAIKKIKAVDPDVISISNISFEQVWQPAETEGKA